MRRLMAMLAIGTLVLAACADDPAVLSSTTSTTNQATTTTVAPTTTTEAPTTTTTFPPRFESSDLFSFATTEPVITNGPNREWDWQFTDPGGATYHDGSIHVLQNGFVGWPAPVGVGYWRSDDLGETWIEVSEDPVFDGTSLDYVGRAALASSVVVEDDGTWTMYFYTWDSSAWPAGESKIGRATAPAPTGPWTAHAQPVLVAGSGGSWDEFAVLAPSVIRTAVGYEMFYAGRTRDTAMIGRATSPDGVEWTKYDNPATTEAPFAESDPVLQPADPLEGDVWDQPNVMQPRVVLTEDGYVMLYTAASTVTGAGRIVQKYGLAVSDDGFDWRRSSDEVIKPSMIDANSFWYTELLFAEDTYFLFVEAGKSGETEVYLATYRGPIGPAANP